MTQTIVPMIDAGSPADIGTSHDHQPGKELSVWRLLTVGVPANWSPTSWMARPPGASPAVPSQVACAVAVLMNARRLQRGGKVRSWTVRIKAAADESSWLTFELPPADGWQPTSPYDIPPCVSEIHGFDKETLKALLEEINASNGPTQRTVVVMPMEHTGDLFSYLPQFIPAGQPDHEHEHADDLELVAV